MKLQKSKVRAEWTRCTWKSEWMDGEREGRRVGTYDGASQQPKEARADLSTRPCIPACPLVWGIGNWGKARARKT